MAISDERLFFTLMNNQNNAHHETHGNHKFTKMKKTTDLRGIQILIDSFCGACESKSMRRGHVETCYGVDASASEVSADPRSRFVR